MTLLDRLLRRRHPEAQQPAGAEGYADDVARPPRPAHQDWRRVGTPELVTAAGAGVADVRNGAGRATRWQLPAPRLTHARAGGDGGLVRGLTTVLDDALPSLLRQRAEHAPDGELPLAVPPGEQLEGPGPGPAAPAPLLVPPRRLASVATPEPRPVDAARQLPLLPDPTPLPSSGPVQADPSAVPAARAEGPQEPAAVTDTPVVGLGPGVRLVHRPRRTRPEERAAAPGAAAVGPVPQGQLPLTRRVASGPASPEATSTPTAVTARAPLDPRPLSAVPVPPAQAGPAAPKPGQSVVTHDRPSAPGPHDRTDGPADDEAPRALPAAPPVEADLPLVGATALLAAAPAVALLLPRAATPSTPAAPAPLARTGVRAHEGPARPAPAAHPAVAAAPPQRLPALDHDHAGTSLRGHRTTAVEPVVGEAPRPGAPVDAGQLEAPLRLSALSSSHDAVSARSPRTPPSEVADPWRPVPTAAAPDVRPPRSPATALPDSASTPRPAVVPALVEAAAAGPRRPLVALPPPALPLALRRDEPGPPPAQPSAPVAAGTAADGPPQDLLARGLAQAEAEVDAVLGATAPAAHDAPAAETGSAVGSSAPVAAASPDVGALADELYEEVRARLRDDLLTARERSASLADL